MTLANPGDTVLVAPGVYSGDGNRWLNFDGKDIVLLSEAGPEVTVIDGLDEPVVCLLFYNGETRACVVEGFTVQHFGGGPLGWPGPGVYCFGASPTISRCTFTHNLSGSEELLDSSGAALFVDSFSLVSDCRFEDNGAVWGGGAVGCGAYVGSDLTFERCMFVGNHGSFYGGAAICGTGTASFLDCLFAENGVRDGGGAVSLSVSSASPLDGTVILERCVLRDNAVSGSGGGIAASAEGSATLVVRDCSFLRNAAGTGGAVACGGNVLASFTNVTMAGNRASVGSGISLGGSFGTQQAIFDRVIVAFGEQGPAVNCDPTGSLSAISCSDIFGNEGGDWVGCLEGHEGVDGNFSAAPLFCDLASGDLTLESSSPCLPGHHPGGSDCGLIGAYGVGCGATATQPSTWGAVKQLFR